MILAEDVSISDLEADEFIALLDHVLEGSTKTFCIENGHIFLEWRLKEQDKLSKAKDLLKQYGLKHGVYYGGVYVRVTASTIRNGAARLTLI